jgi:hypothetical protein
LVIVLAGGVLLRVAMQAGEWPTSTRNNDVYPYVTSAANNLFADPIHPAGYALFLRVLHGIWDSAVVPTITQHVMGLVAGVLVFDIARRLGASDWWSALPAAVVLLSIDQVSIEHFLMTDALSGFLLVAAMWAAVRSVGARPMLWLALSAAFAGVAITVRLTGVVLVPFIVVVACWQHGWRARVGCVAAAGAGLLVVMMPYLVVQHEQTERWSLTKATGWSMYTRVAPFANCSKFTPPPGTEFLCESTPPAERPGTDWYAWGGGPARTVYGDFNLGNTELRSFATAALRAQPLDYASQVLSDFSRFLAPIGPMHSPNGGAGPSTMRVAPGTAVPDYASPLLSSYYGESVTQRPYLLDALGRIQPVMRVGTLLLSAALLLSVVGAIRLRQERRWIVLFVGLALSTLLACVATATFAARYAVPIIPFAFIAAALAGSGLTAPRRRDPEVVEQPTAATPDRPRQLVPVP